MYDDKYNDDDDANNDDEEMEKEKEKEKTVGNKIVMILRPGMMMSMFEVFEDDAHNVL